MTTVASQITSLMVVYSIVYSDADQRKTSKLRVTGLCDVNSPGTGEFPAQRASNAENGSIWWRHHGSSYVIWCYGSLSLTVRIMNGLLTGKHMSSPSTIPRPTSSSRHRRHGLSILQSLVVVCHRCEIQHCVWTKLRHWGWDKMDAISQTTFSNAFSWMKMFEFQLKFHWSLFLGVQLTIFQHWLR